MVPFRATLFSEMKYSFIGEDSLRGSLSEIWIHGSSRHFFNIWWVIRALCLIPNSTSRYSLSFCFASLSLVASSYSSTNQAWKICTKTPSSTNSSTYFGGIVNINLFFECSFWFDDSVFFLNRLTSLKVQSIVWNHQPLHTKSAWLHANKKIKGSEVGTVIQRERVVCLKAYRFIPSCIFTSKPLSMQISLVWTVGPSNHILLLLFLFSFCLTASCCAWAPAQWV